MDHDQRRLQLQTLLEEVLGSSFVYFQPPASKQMSYPCIVYKRDSAETQFADNKPYRHTKRYQLTLIQQDPDGALYHKVAALPMCTYERFMAADNLNHDVFNIFF